LFVGMYDPVSQERLPIVGTNGEVLDDKVVLRAVLNVPVLKR